MAGVRKIAVAPGEGMMGQTDPERAVQSLGDGTAKFARSSVCLSGRRRGGSCGRNRKLQPGVPAGGPVAGVDFAVGLQVHIALHACDREQVADLRTHSDNARLERPDFAPDP